MLRLNPYAAFTLCRFPELTRDCEAVQIPQGSILLLPKGTAVDITQTLGGTYTVHAQGGLFRIAAKDAQNPSCAWSAVTCRRFTFADLSAAQPGAIIRSYP